MPAPCAPEIESFRSNANVAFLMGDMAVFERARRSTQARIDAAIVATA